MRADPLVKQITGLLYPTAESALLGWCRDRLSELYGTIERESERYPFTYTDYYDSIAPDLTRVFFSFAGLKNPGELPDWKHQAINCELASARSEGQDLGAPPQTPPGNQSPGPPYYFCFHPSGENKKDKWGLGTESPAGLGGAQGLDLRPESRVRRINVDPGYVDGARLALASTKDNAQRVYLRDGIYAEITLCHRKSGWQSFYYTFPDFASGVYDSFLELVRGDWRDEIRAYGSSSLGGL